MNNNKVAKMLIRKGDTVKVLSGRDKGKTGEVMMTYPKDRKVIVQGINMVTKHRKPDAENPDGSIVKLEAPILVDKIQLMVGGTATRVGKKRNEEGKLQRYAKKTGDLIK
ncbi:MAG: 50S ribosomal protein L24 [Bacteroidetes bacterium]|nr:50S ribosomal protein L24 [Bacteroidota bacterium]